MLKETLGVTRLLLLGIGLLVLAGCSPDDESGSSTSIGNSDNNPSTNVNGASESTESQQTAEVVAEEAPALADFLSPELHDIDLVEPGTYRFEVAGEVHSGEITGSCAWSMRTEEGEDQDRFQFSSEWQAEDGRSISLALRRYVMHDDFFWNAYHGHEADSVEVRLRDDGGHLGSFDNTASSSMRVRRAKPGRDPIMVRGSGEMPAVRIAADAQQVTAMGELEGPESDFGMPLTGPFTLAVHCAEDAG